MPVPAVHFFRRIRVLGAALIFVAKLSGGDAQRARWTSIAVEGPNVGGEIGRRFALTTENNFLALDLERDFVAPFRHRRTPEQLTKRFGDNAIELGENLHAAVLLAHAAKDLRVTERKDWLVAEVLRTQSASGYIGVFHEEPQGRQMFRNYSFEEASLLVLALTDDHRLFGHAASLTAARKLADYLLDAFSHRPTGIKFSSLGGGQAFLALHSATGDQRYLKFAADEPGGALFVDPAPLRRWKQEVYQTRPLDYEGVRKLTRVLPQGLYPEFGSYTYPTDRVHMYSVIERALTQLRLHQLEPENPRLSAMSARILDGLTDARRPAMTITGAAGWHEGWNEDQDGRGPLGETCASVSLIWFFDEWLRLRSDLRFGDLMERVIYNTLFAAQEPAGRRLRYFTAFSGERRYFELDTYCCPGNFRRGVALLPSMIYYRTPNGFAVNLYTASRVTERLPDGTALSLEQTTDYPNSGDVSLVVSPARPSVFSLALRIPRWCTNPVVTVNGEKMPIKLPVGSAPSLEIRREWRTGDRVRLELPMHWRLVRGCGMQTDRVALMRGPLVYGLSPGRNPGLTGLNSRDLILDIRAVGAIESDEMIRPGGTRVSMRAWKPGSSPGAASDLKVAFTEFPDPSVEEIYFRAPKDAGAVDDELLQRARILVPDTLRFPNEEQLAP